MPALEYRREFQQLVVSAWYLADCVLPHMVERGWGRLFSIGSMVARETRWELPHILPNVVRPAAAGLYRSLAHRHAGTGVTINNLLTGSIVTGRNMEYRRWLAQEQGRSLDEVLAEVSRDIPARRSGRPEEMAALVGFLCSREADLVSGQSIPVNGGFSRHIVCGPARDRYIDH